MVFIICNNYGQLSISHFLLLNPILCYTIAINMTKNLNHQQQNELFFFNAFLPAAILFTGFPLSYHVAKFEIKYCCIIFEVMTFILFYMAKTAWY